MKNRITLLSALLAIASLSASAQRKQIGEARTILKNGKNVEQAEKLMTDLLKDSANLQNKRIYQIWLLSVVRQYEQANERLYLKQKQDTAQFFELTSRLFTIGERLDSIEMQPDRKGRIDIEYRKENAERLAAIRPNLFFGGAYHFRKGNYQKAFKLFESYIDCARQPLFSAYRLDSLDARMPEAGYWAMLSAYRQQDPVLTLRYRHLALRDTAKAEFVLQYMAESRRWLKDDSLYLATLREGFSRYPLNTYFFPRLIDLYNGRRQYETALQTCDAALAACDSCQLYLFAKTNALFNLHRYDEAIALADSLIARNDSMPDAYYTAGTAYLNKALGLDPLRDKKLLRKTYQQARPYMERYRQLAPDQKQKWGPALYRIYLNLNMGKQFDEVDKILKK